MVRFTSVLVPFSTRLLTGSTHVPMNQNASSSITTSRKRSTSPSLRKRTRRKTKIKRTKFELYSAIRMRSDLVVNTTHESQRESVPYKKRQGVFKKKNTFISIIFCAGIFHAISTVHMVGTIDKAQGYCVKRTVERIRTIVTRL